MEQLQKRILEEGMVKDGSILKVDSFLNHQIDVSFFIEIGKEFKRRFSQNIPDKIVTIESSGIAVSFAVSLAMGQIPVVFAKKAEPGMGNPQLYTSQVFSYTRNKTYQISIDKQYIKKDDRILIIDDFLANGHAGLGLLDIVSQAQARAVGFGAVIEKGFQDGRGLLEAKGMQVESLAVIREFRNNQVVFDQQV